MVMNHYDSACNRHPNPARGCAESVNWNLKGAKIMAEKGFDIMLSSTVVAGFGWAEGPVAIRLRKVLVRDIWSQE